MENVSVAQSSKSFYQKSRSNVLETFFSGVPLFVRGMSKRITGSERAIMCNLIKQEHGAWYLLHELSNQRA